MAAVRKTLPLFERLEPLTNAQLADAYNAVSERKVTKFSDHSTAVKRTAAALEAAGMDIDAEGRAASPEVVTHNGDERVITVHSPNPKMVGSRSHDRYALYRTGMTVGEYTRLASAKYGGGRRKASRDILWDSRCGHITLR